MKKVLLIISILFLSAILVACSSDSNAPSENDILEQANALMEEGKYEEAIALYQSIESYQIISSKITEAESLLSETSNNYLYTNVETPIFTIKSEKHENLTNELIKKGVISENADNFLNLDSTYARIRIPKDYEKLIKILKQVL